MKINTEILVVFSFLCAIGSLSDVTMDLATNYQHCVQKVSRQRQTKLQYEIKSDHHIRRIAEKMTGWEEKYDLFHLDVHEVSDIKHGANRDRPALQR